MLQRAQPHLPPEVVVRLDTLRPCSLIGGILRRVRKQFDSWGRPKPVTAADVVSITREYHARVAAGGVPLLPDERIVIMNALVEERFPDLDETTNRIVRFYFYHRI